MRQGQATLVLAAVLVLGLLDGAASALGVVGGDASWDLDDAARSALSGAGSQPGHRVIPDAAVASSFFAWDVAGEVGTSRGLADLPTERAVAGSAHSSPSFSSIPGSPGPSSFKDAYELDRASAPASFLNRSRVALLGHQPALLSCLGLVGLALGGRPRKGPRAR